MDRPPFGRRRLVSSRGAHRLSLLALSAAWTLLGTSGSPALGAEATATVAADQDVVEMKGSFESQGKTIAIERYEPKGPGKYPAVLVVHGAGGMTVGGPWFRDAARALARRGYVAHLVHYFDLTGTRLADPQAMKTHFAAWMRVLADGVTNASRQPNVDPGRVGLLGFSLGSYLSVSLSVYDPRVSAVVEYFGGLPDALAGQVKTLPPILILHGDADPVVPVAQGKALERICKENGAVHEVCIYPGQGHGFLGETGHDATRRTLAFFDAHLKHAPAHRTRETAAVPNLETFVATGDKAPGGK